MGKTGLPQGFQFHPTDLELIKYYLKRKVLGRKIAFEAIAEVDIYKYAPWDLPDKACLQSHDQKWYFFCPRDRKSASGSRLNRATDSGYWKVTGKDRLVEYNGEVVGTIKTLVFYKGRPPKGVRSDWVLHEYRLEEKNLSDKGFVQDSYVLCAVSKKEGPGPKDGTQYGAPFRERDWSNVDDDNCEEGPSSEMTLKNILPPGSYTCEINDVFSHESCLTDMIPPSVGVAPPVFGKGVPAEKVQSSNDDEILALLDSLEKGPFEVDRNDINKSITVGWSTIPGSASYNEFFVQNDHQVPVSDLEHTHLLLPTFIQELISVGKIFEICFPCTRMPDWCTNWSSKSSVSIKLSPEDNFSSKRGIALCVVFAVKEHEDSDEAWQQRNLFCHFAVNNFRLGNPLIFESFQRYGAGSWGLCCYVPEQWFVGWLNRESSVIEASIATDGLGGS